MENNAKEIADIVIQQLGGIRKLHAMINAKNFSYNSEGRLIFEFSGCKKCSVVGIQVNWKDLYDVVFYKRQRKTYELLEVGKFADVYNTDLIRTFEEFTGLYLSL